jgi:hypothetical protein
VANEKGGVPFHFPNGQIETSRTMATTTIFSRWSIIMITMLLFADSHVSSLDVGEMGDNTGSIMVSEGCALTAGQIHTLVEVIYLTMRLSIKLH